MRKLFGLFALSRLARLGTLGLAVGAYTFWRQLSHEDQAAVRKRAASLVKRGRSQRMRSRAIAAPAESLPVEPPVPVEP